METNTLPHYDDSINTTGCCPRFNPAGWDRQKLHFENKAFVRATTRGLLHIPINMGRIFSRVQGHIEEADAFSADNTVVLSRDLSSTEAEHLFSVSKPVPEEDNVTLTGDFITKVFEGPYRKVILWHREMQELVEKWGGNPGDVYFFYTTCPKCARVYKQNYIVGVAGM